MAQKRRILGRNALVVTLSGEKAGAAQIYNYDLIREVRMDLENLEIKVLMTYDEAYLRVFSVENKDKLDEENLKIAKGQVLKFYNDLITASMKFTKEEIENLKKQHDELKKQIEEAQKKQEEAKASDNKEEK